jgi:phage gpG-like protein
MAEFTFPTSEILSVNAKGEREGGLTISFEGEEKLLKNLQKLTKKIVNPTPLHKLWGLSVERWVKKNFEQEGKLISPSGWIPLSPVTIKLRRKGKGKAFKQRAGGRPDQILSDTGRLKASFSSTPTKREVTIFSPKAGSSVTYAKIHQFGGFVVFQKGGKKAKIPARPMLPTEFKMIKKDIETIAINYIEATK